MVVRKEILMKKKYLVLEALSSVRKSLVLLLAAAVLSAGVTGCSASNGDAVETESNEMEKAKEYPVDFVIGTYHNHEITMQELWVYAFAMQAQYEEVYGTDVWFTPIGEDSEGNTYTFADSVRSGLMDQIMMVAMMNEKVAEYGIELTDEERESSVANADQFMTNLTEDQIKTADLNSGIIEKVLLENTIADKVYDAVTKELYEKLDEKDYRQRVVYDVQFELYKNKSDNESGMTEAVAMTKKQKRRQKAKAEQALVMLKSGTSYSKVKKSLDASLSGEIVYCKANEDSFSEDLIEAANNLKKEGDYSEIIEAENAYHVLVLVSEYDKSKTMKYLNENTDSIKSDLFAQQMTVWQEEEDKDWNYDKEIDSDALAAVAFESVLSSIGEAEKAASSVDSSTSDSNDSSEESGGSK